ncbi:MAG: type IV toxin-antitoxin system AbiEi family antitoxin domain-containing protein [Candidatus Omnitrophica bacterium]|nr:type IV toxin-antitoxin system AbiEi family antitoxin domain-containing protein [Candidatus Omnitrophota bacterium]
MKTTSGIDKKNRKLLDSLNRFGKNLFSVKDAAEIMELPIKNARLYLSYFERRGWLSRIKPGLYISVPLGIVNPQEYKENPWIVANKVFSPCYIGGWSAAEHWDLTDQIFSSIFVFTGRLFRKKDVKIQSTDFVLKLVRMKNIRHTKSVWIENVKVQVSDPTQTIVDMLDDPAVGGGIRHVAEIVKNYFNSEHRDDSGLLKYISENNNRTIHKRLGHIIETLNIQAPNLIEVCRKNISAGYSILDPTIKNKGTFNRKWNLRVNAEIKK